VRSDLTKPIGKGRIFTKTGFDHELDQLLKEGEDFIKAHAAQ
jgi:hypothetical protein